MSSQAGQFYPGSQPGLKAIEMWWIDIVVPALLLLGAYCFAVMVGFRTRMLTRKTTRTAENMYPLYADSLKKQQKYAKEHGGTWKDDGDSSAP